MPLKYTSAQKIAARLRGRLEVPNANAGGIPFGSSPSSLGAQQVDLGLLEQIGIQVEAKVDSVLYLIYVLPVPDTATQAKEIIGSIVEKFVLSELAEVYFQQSQNPELGGDAGFGSVMRRQAQQELQALCAGHGIYVPGLMPAPTTASYGQQPIVLPGVRLRGGDIPDTITRNYTVVATRSGGKASEIDWGV